MWFIDTRTLTLKEFPTEAGLEYAILSHRWGNDEVLFKDLNGSKDLNLLRNKQGFSKIKRCCKQASRDQYLWAWVDTCCIDKSSSAELSEAINSMFHWYRKSSVCYAYLSDVDTLHDIEGSEWFKRGWTLQELLAPTRVHFFSRDWTFLSDKRSLRVELETITSIPERALLDFQSKYYCVAEKMSWAAERQTTREEDLAYCLIGLFDINMPLLYGERTKAFCRLQETIMEFSTDLSIFLWNGRPCTEFGLLAASPSCFCVEVPYNPTQHLRDIFDLPEGWRRNNAGISIQLFLYPHHINEDQHAVFVASIHEPLRFKLSGFGIFLEEVRRPCQKSNYRRVSVDNQTSISLATLAKMPVYSTPPGFVANLLIAPESRTSLTSAGSSRFMVIWEAQKPLKAQLCKRLSDPVDASFEHWPIVASELPPRRTSFLDYLHIEAQGILGYLIARISDSLRLLVCFGFDVRFLPVCVVIIYDERFYKNKLRSWNVMCAYEHLFHNMERDIAKDHSASVYAIKASEGQEDCKLFNNTMILKCGP